MLYYHVTNPAGWFVWEGDMQASGEEFRKSCKMIEDEINQKLLSKTNSLTFVAMVGEALEEHLNQLESLRKSSNQWLNSMCLPDKDDFVFIAKKVISIEDRLDRMDEKLYQTLEIIKENRRQLGGLMWEIAKLSADFSQGKEIDKSKDLIQKER